MAQVNTKDSQKSKETKIKTLAQFFVPVLSYIDNCTICLCVVE